MATVKYTGARYVPIFAEPLEWQSGKEYDNLTICTYNGKSYVSKRLVSKTIGNPASNPSYWLEWADPSGQMESLRRWVQDTTDNMVEEVETYDDRITQNTNKISASYHKNIVVIGDSWSDPNSVTVENNVNWVSIWKQIEPGNNIYNFAKAGRGFLTGNPNYLEQLQNAFDSEDFNNNEIDTVIIVGAINDWTEHKNPGDYTQTLRLMAQRISDVFVNAKAYVFFASCARPRAYEQNVTGNWSDLLNLNSSLCRFINQTMSSSLGTDAARYRRMRAYNITHCFTEQCFKEWLSDNYLRHLSYKGHWQLYKSIMHCLECGSEPEIPFYLPKLHLDNSVFNDITIWGKFTPLKVKARIKFSVTEQITQSGQVHIPIPENAWYQDTNDIPQRFFAKFRDIFPNTVLDTSPLMYINEPVDGINPLVFNANEAKITRGNYPNNSKICTFFGFRPIFNVDDGIYFKHASTSFPTATGIYFVDYEIDFTEVSPSLYWMV